MILPRQYQSNAQECTLREFDGGANSTLVVMPTGSGKTILFATIGDCRPWGKVLILAGRRELIDQAQDKIFRVTGDKPDIEMADQYAPTIATDIFASSKYVVASIQTLCKQKRLGRFDWREFGLVVIDECHHAMAKSYLAVLDRIRLENPAVKVLGVTATPDRLDRKALGKVFETVAFRYEINQAIDDGWLVPVHQKFCNITGLDFSHVRTKGGDLDESELKAVLMDDGGDIPHKVASAMIQAARDEKAVIFCADVSHAKRTAEIICRQGKKAVAIDCTWDKEKRRATLAAYERGEFQFLANFGLFLEGWDCPGVSVVGMARPTKSRALYAQAVGRGLRTLPGIVDTIESAEGRKAAILASPKQRALVVDLVGNSGSHKLVCSADILGGDYEEEVVERAKKRAKKRKTPVDMRELLDDEKAKLAGERAESEERRERAKRRVYGRAQMELYEVDPFGRDADYSGEGMAGRGHDLATGPQLEMLERAGIDARGMTKRDAGRLIGEIQYRRKNGLCTLKMRKRLNSAGYDAELMPIGRAVALLDMQQATGWKLEGHVPSREDLAVRPRDGSFVVVMKKPDGSKVSVGKPHQSVEDARAYGLSLIGE